jgi:hypothetical protein
MNSKQKAALVFLTALLLAAAVVGYRLMTPPPPVPAQVARPALATPAPAGVAMTIQMPQMPAAQATAAPVVPAPTNDATRPVMAQLVAPPTSAAIQDGKTHDFSSGKMVVKDSPDEQAIIARSVREMEEAASGVTFGPAAPAQKKGGAEPSPAPPRQ